MREVILTPLFAEEEREETIFRKTLKAYTKFQDFYYRRTILHSPCFQGYFPESTRKQELQCSFTE